MQADSVSGRPVVDANGERVGTSEAVLVSTEDGRPRWLRVRLADTDGARLVPASAASVDSDGALRLAWSREAVIASPEPQGEDVSTEDSSRLQDHYGMDPDG